MIYVNRMVLNGVVMTEQVLSVNLQPMTDSKFFPSPSAAQLFLDKLGLLPSDIRKTLDPAMRMVPGWTYSLEDLRDSASLTHVELPLPSDADETIRASQGHIGPLVERWRRKS